MLERQVVEVVIPVLTKTKKKILKKKTLKINNSS